MLGDKVADTLLALPHLDNIDGSSPGNVGRHIARCVNDFQSRRQLANANQQIKASCMFLIAQRNARFTGLMVLKQRSEGNQLFRMRLATF